MKSFKQFTEAKKKEIVFTFGRFNPPTIGHGKLITKVASVAKGNNYHIYASQVERPEEKPVRIQGEDRGNAQDVSETWKKHC